MTVRTRHKYCVLCAWLGREAERQAIAHGKNEWVARILDDEVLHEAHYDEDTKGDQP